MILGIVYDFHSIWKFNNFAGAIYASFQNGLLLRLGKNVPYMALSKFVLYVVNLKSKRCIIAGQRLT
jgi:hypothetical protein